MKRAFAIFILVLMGTTLARAQSNPCIAGSTTNCTSAAGAPFTLSSTSGGWPNVCMGEPISVTATPSTGLAGLLQVTTTTEYCWVSTTVEPLPGNQILTNWWRATNTPFNGWSNGLTATFTPTNCGTGTLTFNLGYQEAALCGGGSNNVSLSVNYTVVSVASLSPVTPTNYTLLSSTPTLQVYKIPVSTNPAVTNLVLTATSCPSLPLASLPECWSLDGARATNAYVPITAPGIFTVVCSAGTSVITNIIWVVDPKGEVEQGCSANGNGILGYWSFNNSIVNWWRGESNGLDSVGTNDATPVNISYVPGISGSAFYFSGGSYLNFVTTPGRFGTNNFTIDFWVSTWSTGDQGILGKPDSCSFGNMWAVTLKSGGYIGFYICENTSGKNYATLTTHEQINNGLYHEITVNRTGQTLSLYVDGQYDNSITTTGIANITNSSVMFGGLVFCGSGNYFTGALDEIKLAYGWPDPWIGSQDQEPISEYGVQNPNTPWAQGLRASTTNLANLAYAYMNDNGTANINCMNGAVSFWFKPDWNGGSGPGHTGELLQLGPGTSAANWSLSVNSNGSNLSFQTSSNGNSTIYFVQSITNWSTNNWYQLTLNYSTNATSLYINGVLAQEGVGLTNYPSITNRVNYGFSVGSSYNGSNQIGGTIDELYTFSCPLGPQEVLAGFPGYYGYLGADRAAFVAIGASNYVAYSPDGINWSSAIMPTNDNWGPVAYGNGMFVANTWSTNDTAAYSYDGATWLQTSMPEAAAWSAVTYGNGEFVSLAFASTNAAYSSNGITWLTSRLPVSNYWTAATYGNGIFVGIANDSSNSVYSTNGIVWSNSAGLPAPEYWGSVTFGNGVFVTVSGDSEAAAYSTNGVTWWPSAMPTYGNWSVAFGNGLFVAISCYDDQAAYSSDGIHWTLSSMPYWDDWYTLTFGNGMFVAVTVDSQESAYSTDGIHWQSGHDLPEIADWMSIAGRTPGDSQESTGPSILTEPVNVIVGDGQSATFSVTAIGTPWLSYQWQFDGTNIAGATASALTIPVVRSTNAGTYTVSVSNTGGTAYSTGATLSVLAPPAFVAIGTNSAAYSYDGIHWLPSPTGMPATTNWKSLAYGGGVFVAVASQSTNAAYSTDGIHWTASPTGLPIWDGWDTVAYGDGVFVALISGNAFGAYSYDGIDWYSNSFAMPTGWSGVAYGNGLFAAVGPGWWGGPATNAYSDDGIDWFYGDGGFPMSDTNYCIAYGDGTFIALGANDTNVSYGYDGIFWTNSSVGMPAQDSWTSVAYGEGRFVAVATGAGDAPYSTDGLHWTDASIPSDNWQSITYGNGKFVAVAGGGSSAAYSANGISWTSSSLPTNDGWVAVIAGNDPGSIGSQSPSITTQPTSQIVFMGTNVNLAVTVTGTGPLSYHWQFNGVTIPGATNSTLSLTNVQPGNAGTYSVYIDNAYGASASAGAVLTVVSVGSLMPVNNTNLTLASSNATEQIWTVLVSTDPSVSNLTVVATPSPNLPLSSLPAGWLLDGVNTNTELVNITFPGIHTLVCKAGTSSVTNIIWVLSLGWDVEAECGTNGPAVLGYWSFNTNYAGNSGQLPLTNYGVQNPASPWTNALKVDTNIAANISYRYAETNGVSNIYCISGAVRFWFRPDWNGGAGPTNAGQLVVMGNGTNSLWSINIAPGGSNMLFQTESNSVVTTYFTNSITNFNSNTWYAVTLDYSTSQTELYINGLLAQSGPGIVSYPSISDRMVYGFSIGSDHTGQSQSHACFDEFYTYSCPLAADQVLSNYILDLLSADSTGASGIGIPYWGTYNSIYGLANGSVLQVYTPLK